MCRVLSIGARTFALTLSTFSGDAQARALIIRKLLSLIALSEMELARVQGLGLRRDSYDKGREIVRQWDDYRDIFLIVDGWVAREKYLSDGRRVIVNFALPGDILCLNGFLFRKSAHSLRTITPATVIVLNINDLIDLFADFPRIGVGFAWINACEESLIQERLASLTARTAYERMAHLLLELWSRLEFLGLTNEGSFRLPVTQSDLADALGMSTVHVNRTLSALRRSGLIDSESVPPRSIGILDREKLEQAANFHDGHLNFAGDGWMFDFFNKAAMGRRP